MTNAQGNKKLKLIKLPSNAGRLWHCAIKYINGWSRTEIC